jgi:pyochelin biosynthetic protein PchC
MTGSTGNAGGLCLRPYRTVRQPRFRLVCFPHAGGAASSFRTWPQHLPVDVELLAACYPGREGRLREPLVARMDVLVKPFVDACLLLLDRPLALFGHSMGGSVAHEVAVRMDETPAANLCGLFVSGRVPPQRLPQAGPTGFEDDATLIKDILRLGHGHAEVFSDPELRELILPSIRADHRLVATYRPGRRKAISAPVVAYGGVADPDVTVEDIRAWSEITTGPFAYRLFPGNHFYLERQEKQLVQDIAERLNSSAAEAPTHSNLAP